MQDQPDGLEAIRRAQELDPDLIRMDIGLPGFNGIEAARQIRKLVPRAKNVFLSQENSVETVQLAFSLGALGYVVKLNAASELLTAVETALMGTSFVSSNIHNHKI
jgi:DNA-binding NarL/FixJ family response regulator